MALLAQQTITRAGLAPTYAAAGGAGDSLPPGAQTFLHVKNANAAACTVTIITQQTDPLGNAVADNTISVPATTGDRMIGPLPASAYANPATGNVDVTYSLTASVTVAAIALTQP